MPSKRPEQLGPKIGQSETEAGKFHNEYAVENFYVGATDKHHTSQTVRTNQDKNARSIRVPTFVWALINKWVDDERTPYRTAADVIRDAVVHRLHQLQNLAEEPKDGIWRSMEIQVEMKRRAAESEGMKSAIQEVREMMTMAWTDGDLGMYELHKKDAEKMVKELPEPYKGMLSSFLNEQSTLRRFSAPSG